MRSIVEILMTRDGMTKEEAINTIKDCREEMEYEIECGNYFMAEEVFESYLGLEPDYMMQMFGF